MSRTTQIIGLCNYARRWVERAISTEIYPRMTLGMFQEEIPGRIFHMPAPEGPNKALVAKEVVQVEPWSSGPMIFTHLHLTLVKESGEEVDMGCAFSWMFDPSMGEREYDDRTGRYCV